MQKMKRQVDRTLEWILILLMAANVLNVLWQVFTRFVLKDPSSYTEELARYLLIWVGLLGAGYAAGMKMHLAIDLVLAKTTGRLRAFFELSIQALIFLFALFAMVAGGVRLVAITLTLDQVSAALQIKLGYVYLALPLSGLLIMFYSLHFIMERLRMDPVPADRPGSD
ncbi:MAG: TRAP transporter small permease [Planctomycetota bacterium]|jgi:TRAP-type C4-dicarboxylate transport system permease small subunit